MSASCLSFCDNTRRNRRVYYYDATVLGSNYAVNEQDCRWMVIHEFERRGWRCETIYLGNPMRHDEKYLLINQGFAGKQRLVPFFNRSNNEDLILAIQSAGVSRGRMCVILPTRDIIFVGGCQSLEKNS